MRVTRFLTWTTNGGNRSMIHRAGEYRMAGRPDRPIETACHIAIPDHANLDCVEDANKPAPWNVCARCVKHWPKED